MAIVVILNFSVVPLAKEWIIEKFWVLRRSFPDAELWITDHKPQSMPLWNGLREFLADTNLPVDGVGIRQRYGIVDYLIGITN